MIRAIISAVSAIEHSDSVARFGAGRTAAAIVVIGFSAGGLSPLRQLMSCLNRDFPAAIVIAHHVTKSVLPDLLPLWTRIPAAFARNGEGLRAGRAYVCPVDSHIIVNPDATLSLSPRERIDFMRPSIDWLFDSASASYGQRTIAVLLSGGQSDGAIGVRRVRERGGSVIVQEPSTASQSAMPLAAGGAANLHVHPEELGNAVTFQLGGVQTEDLMRTWDLPFGPLPM